MDTIAPFSSPLYVMAKPAGSSCNLACRYCYYLEKSRLYDGAQGGSRMMADATLERFIGQYIEAQTTPQVLFTWHGGESLMRPIAFYQRALELQRRYARGRQVDNCIQTNGTLLNDEWCRFLKDNGFLVGISIDGPQEFHDPYRRDRKGRPSWAEVMRGIGLLEKHGVEWNALAVINNLNVGHPVEFYRFFKGIGCRFLQFTPVVERTVTRADGLTLAPGMSEGGEVTAFSVRPEEWGEFLCGVYDEWVRRDVGQLYVQLFDATLANWVGAPAGICTLSPSCGHAAVIEANGDVYACDHFVYPEYQLGNIGQKTLTEMMLSPQQRDFGRRKIGALPRQCRECEFLPACYGECPKNRFVRDRYGEPGLNYLCAGYRRFFEHVAGDMDFMANELAAHRPPANIMRMKK